MSGRHPPSVATANDALFAACEALDLSAMRRALDLGAKAMAVDAQDAHPLGVLIRAWAGQAAPPNPDPLIRLLARHGADVNAAGRDDGDHPFGWLTATDRDVVLIDALVDEGLVLEAGAVDEGMLLTEVVRHRAAHLLHRLIEFGVDVNATEDDAQTALHALVDATTDERGKRDSLVDQMMITLARAGIDEEIENFYRETALDRFANEAPELLDAWALMKEVARQHGMLEARLPEAIVDATAVRRL